MVTLCLVVGVIGVLLIALSVIPASSGRIPGDLSAGISLVVLAIIGYVALALVGAA